MAKSKDQLQEAVLEVGVEFAASMDKLLVTELNYLKYLRNRKRFHIGVRNIISNGLGSGKFPDDPNPTLRRNPREPRGFGGVGVPIPVPIGVPEKVKEKQEDEKEKCDVPVPVIVPKKDKQDDGANDIKEFEREPSKVPALVPQGQLVPSDVAVPNTGSQVFDAPGDEIFNAEPLSDFFSFNVPQVNWPEINIDWQAIGAGLGALFLFPFKGLLGGEAMAGEMNSTDIYSQPTETIIGEDGPEIVFPVEKFGDAIAMVYKDGAQVFIGTTQNFLSGLPASPGKSAVLGEANALAAIFGITDKGDGSSSFALGIENPITLTSTSTVEKEDLDLEGIEKKSLKEAAKSGGESRVAKRRKSKKSFEEVKAEIDAKELAKQQRKANKRGSGAKPNPFSDASEQVKIPSDGNGNDRFNQPIILNNSTENAWQRAVRDAANDGVDLTAGVNSSFRTPEQQQNLLDLSAAGDPSVVNPAEIGASPHQQGWALDIGVNTNAHKWMLGNGKKYGFEWQGKGDPVHFNFVNNESNTKWLEPTQTDWQPPSMEGVSPDLSGSDTHIEQGDSSTSTTNINPPQVQSEKEMVNSQSVNQMDKNMSSVVVEPAVIPIPMPQPVVMPAPQATKETKEIKRTLIMDTFDKGARLEVAYV